MTDSASTAPDSRRILVVEDCQPNQTLAMALLSNAGYSVEAATDGREAILAVAGGGYDLVLMDLMMPGMDGLTATRLLRELPPPVGDIPILAMTASNSDADRARCLEAGMNGHIAKPFDRAQLLNTVARWLDHASPSDGGRPRPMPAAVHEPAGVLDAAAIGQLAQDLGPELLGDVLRQFLDETMERAERIAAEPDLSLLMREAHTLKSTAGTFGARTLASAARALEMACRAGSVDEAEALRATVPHLARAAVAAYRQAGWLSS